MSAGARRNWLWYATRCGILAAAALAFPMAGYSRGRVLGPTATLTAANGVEIGYSAASSADGTVMVVGAPNTTISGVTSAGAAYVFLEPASGWSATPVQSVRLSAFTPQQSANLGESVAISSDGSTIVVGAPSDNAGLGAAYVFHEPTGGWSSVASESQNITLTASDGVANDMFGISVGMDATGTTVIVGAEYHTVTAGTAEDTQAGAAYIFTAPSGSWSQAAELTASDATAYSDFGVSVAIRSATAVVGSPSHTVGSNADQGAAYVFTPSGTSWSQAAELAATGGAAGDYFGTSVATSGTTAVVGAPGASSSQGAAYVFTASSWSQVAALTASGATSGNFLGQSVAISADGSTIVAGAPGAPPASTGSYSQGTMYQFDQPSRGKTTLPWGNETQTDTFQFSKSAQTSPANFGVAAAVGLATGNSWVFAGAPGTGTSQGTAYVFSGK